VADDCGEVLDVDADVWTFFELLGGVGVLAEEIADFFLVDFEVGNSDKKPAKKFILSEIRR